MVLDEMVTHFKLDNQVFWCMDLLSFFSFKEFVLFRFGSLFCFVKMSKYEYWSSSLLMQVLFECDFQHTQQESIQLFPISIVSGYCYSEDSQIKYHVLAKKNFELIWFSGSFVSVVHLLVGVTYCLISWTVGLPKRAVSSFSALL